MQSAEKNIIFHVGPTTQASRVRKKLGLVVDLLVEADTGVGFVNEGVYQADSGEFAEAKMFTGEDSIEVVEGILPYAVQDLTGRMPKVSDIPTINEPLVLDVGQNKANFHALLPEVTAQTLVVPAKNLGIGQLSDTIDEIRTPTVVVKPVIGHGAKGLFIGTKREALDYILHAPEEHLIIQEQLTNRTKSALTAYGQESKSKLSEASHAELRLFVTPDKIVPLGKIWSPTKPDEKGGMYTALDIYKTPQPALDLAKLCLEAFMEYSGSKKFFGAIDVWLTEDEDWKIIEANVKELARPNSIPFVGRKVSNISVEELIR